jgi:N utilization substance protein B
VDEENERLLVFPGEDLDDPEDVMPPRWDYRETACQLADLAYREREAFDARISGRLKKWRIDRLTMVDRLILHLGLAELSRPAGPSARVILNEWIEVAKDFGTAKSAGFVNGVLDALARELRPIQLKAREAKK